MLTKKVIKKRGDKNQYLLTPGGNWVRDFGSRIRALDINTKLYTASDQKLAVTNESENKICNVPQIDAERIFHGDMVIVSDGYDYKSCVPLLKEFGRKKIPCIGVHSVLGKWEQGIRYNYYVVNNPAAECMSYLPAKSGYTPNCIASVRTNPEFVRRYRARGAVMHWYTPSPSEGFRSKFFEPQFFVDDYRNAICAAVSLCCRWQVSRLLLLSPHDLYPEARPAAEKLPNGLSMYPQQRTAHDFIDAALYWLTRYNDCEIGVVTSGPQFDNAKALTVEEAGKFFASDLDG